MDHTLGHPSEPQVAPVGLIRSHTETGSQERAETQLVVVLVAGSLSLEPCIKWLLSIGNEADR